MKLPFFFKSKNPKEVFFGLFLKENDGIALLLVRNAESIEVKEKIKFSYTNGWENLTEDVDEVLYRLEHDHHLEISKTIFFVYSHLVDDKTSDIKKPYLNKIKDLVKNLELEAMGYIECFEAVSFYLENSEETSLTAVLLELDKKQLGLFVYKGGKMSYKNILSRTDNIVDDFVLAVDGIKNKKMLLPSRIIIYDSDNIDDAATKIISHRWESDYFVQIPKVDILKEEEVIEGLIQVFAGQTKNKTVKEPPAADQSFGFVIGEDIGQTGKIEEKKQNVGNAYMRSSPRFPKINLPKFSFPKINLSFLKGKTAVLIGILIISLSLFLNEYFFHKANLTVYLPSQSIEKKMSQSIDYEVASGSAEMTETISSTGKKEVGDKAKGSVTVHNFDDRERTFSKGTVLEASGIKFVLDSDVKVASSSLAADGSAKLPGKSNAAITSQNIGAEGNLSKGSRFKIDDLSTSVYFAINESALAGGSKREIKTASLTDINNLEKNVLNKAKKQIKKPSFSKDKVVLSELSETKIIEAKYSKEIGEEGDKVSLSAKTETIYYAYDKSLLIDLLLRELKQELKQGFSIKSEQLSYKINQAEIDKSELDLEILAKAKAIPEFDQKEVIKKISGKNQKKLETILKSDFKVQGYDVTINEPLPILNRYLPFFYKNIVLNISSL